MRRGILNLNGSRVASRAAARSCASTIEPVHKLAVIVPDTEDQDHAAAKGLAHSRQAAKLVCTAVNRSTPGGVDGVSAGSGHGARDGLIILLVDAADFAESASCGSIIGDKLRYHREGL